MSDADRDRADELEITLAHQGRTIEELSEEVRRQGETIDRLEKTLKELAQRFMALEETATPRPEITRPPHY